MSLQNPELRSQCQDSVSTPTVREMNCFRPIVDDHRRRFNSWETTFDSRQRFESDFDFFPISSAFEVKPRKGSAVLSLEPGELGANRADFLDSHFNSDVMEISRPMRNSMAKTVEEKNTVSKFQKPVALSGSELRSGKTMVGEDERLRLKIEKVGRVWLAESLLSPNVFRFTKKDEDEEDPQFLEEFIDLSGKRLLLQGPREHSTPQSPMS
mgnify:CR=1 FL=1